jgi:hypothetical protein
MVACRFELLRGSDPDPLTASPRATTASCLLRPRGIWNLTKATENLVGGLSDINVTVLRLFLDSKKPYVGAFFMRPNRSRVREVHVYVLGTVIL